MAPLFFPLDQIRPSEVLYQYSEWIYFALMLVFFIAIAGLTLKRHFDRPYVKPLIISVGLMLTVGMFKFKHVMPRIFEAMGLVGSIALVAVAAMIPYGLSRGFGMRAGKAFYLTYILVYIIGWIRFPDLYFLLGKHNLGLINLLLLIVFIVAIVKVAIPMKGFSLKNFDMAKSPVERPEVDREIDVQENETHLMKANAEPFTRIEIRTLADVKRSLEKIRQIVQSRKNNLGRKERERLAGLVQGILKKESLFNSSIVRLKKLYTQMKAWDQQQLKAQQARLPRLQGEERKVLQAEIATEGKKLQLEKQIVALESALDPKIALFNQNLGQAVNRIRSVYSYDAKPYLDQGATVLSSILGLLRKVKHIEEQLESMIKKEKKLLQSEIRTT
jgi:hypothetical protein